MAKKKAADLEWPADKVDRTPIKKLVPYARNARKHSPEQIAQIRASMREFGWTMPILRDEKDGIIAGHGRILAAFEELNTGDKRYATVPCITARGWSEAKKRAYVLADNKLTLNASWDDQMLREELKDLAEAGFDLALTGFDQGEIDDLFGEGDAPEDFKDLDPDSLETEHKCPKCGYEWSGGAK